jgi:hypothetical protein
VVFSGIYGLIVGIGMIGQWSISLLSEKVPELKTEPYRIAFHLVGELLTSLALIVGGIGLLTGAEWGQTIYLVAAGMLLYTVIVSPGYSAERREWPMVVMFAILLILALVSLALVV